jgi:hypothetical protein
MYHKFELATLKLLFDLEGKLSMNFEDELLLYEGLHREHKILNPLGLSFDEKVASKVTRRLGILRNQMSYLQWASKTKEDAASVLQKIEIVNLKACVEGTAGENLVDKVNKCIAKRCALSKMTCQKIKDEELSSQEDILSVTIAAWTKPNVTLACPTQKLKDEFQDRLEEPTFCWKKWYSSHKRAKKDLVLESLTEKDFKELKIPKLSIDREISFQKSNLPETFIQKSYCYFVFQKVDGYGNIPIDQFAYATEGAVIDLSKLKDYRRWLGDKEGQTCQKLVKLFTGEEPAQFANIDRHKKFMMIVNPLAALGGGLNSFNSLIVTDINHERLHLIYADSSKLQRKVKEEWETLSQREKQQFKNEHPHFDFGDEKELLREYFSFSRQEHPSTL